MKWLRQGDEEIWVEIARDGDTAHLRGPAMVIRKVQSWAGHSVAARLTQTEEDDGRVWHLTGKCPDMVDFIGKAKIGGPGPLERMMYD